MNPRDVGPLDFILCTHGHYDHTWGLASFIKHLIEAKKAGASTKTPTIITHPKTFLEKLSDKNTESGSLLSLKKAEKTLPIKLSKSPLKLTEKLTYLGEIERTNNFEAQKPLGKVLDEGKFKKDFIEEDSAIIFEKPEGLILITGCSHSGICNIIEYAEKLFNKKIIDIIGGLHLINTPEERLEKTADFLKQKNIRNIHACHCTDLKSKIFLSTSADIIETGIGTKLNYN